MDNFLQEAESRNNADGNADSNAGNAEAAMDQSSSENQDSEEALLQRALAMSMQQEDSGTSTEAVKEKPKAAEPDLASMTEDEQIALAMRMSMQDSSDDKEEKKSDEAMEVDEEKEDYSDAMNDPRFLQVQF